MTRTPNRLNPKPVHRLFVDVTTRGVRNIIHALEQRATTHKLENLGPYREDPSYTLLAVETTLDAAAFDQWASSRKWPDGTEVIGTISASDSTLPWPIK